MMTFRKTCFRSLIAATSLHAGRGQRLGHRIPLR